MPSKAQVVTGGDIRATLASWLAANEPITRMIPEFWIPKSNSRADLAVIGSLMTGYEIKARDDRLSRLSVQAAAYATVFDRCVVVVAERHLRGALAVLPDWWGVLVVDEGQGFASVRSPRENPVVCVEVLVQLLWAEDARAVLRDIGRSAEPNASRYEMWKTIVELFNGSEVRGLVRRVLETRRDDAKRFGAGTSADMAGQLSSAAS